MGQRKRFVLVKYDFFYFSFFYIVNILRRVYEKKVLNRKVYVFHFPSYVEYVEFIVSYRVEAIDLSIPIEAFYICPALLLMILIFSFLFV